MDNGVLCATEREALTALLRGGVSPFTAKKALDLAARKGGASIYFGGGRRGKHLFRRRQTLLHRHRIPP